MEEFKKVASLSERIKQAMGLSGIRQIELSKVTGIDKGSITHYINGDYEPKQTAVYKLAKALDVSEMWLWGYDAPMERPQSQKDNDELADLIDHLKKEKDFRQLIIRISRLKPEQILLLKSMVDSWSG